MEETYYEVTRRTERPKEAISAQFDETMNIYPNKKLKVKESWSEKDNINQGPMKGSSDLTRTLVSVDPKNTKIAVKGTQQLKGSDTQEGMKMSVNAKANINGTILIDTQSGWINNVNLTKKETHRNSQKFTETDRNSQKLTETHRNSQKRIETHRN